MTAIALDGKKARSIVLRIGGFALSCSAMMLVVAGHTFAESPAVSIPSGSLHDGQAIVVSGSGFPPRSQDPTGLQMLECSDPQGKPANLPTDATYNCDGTTSSSSEINTDAKGTFRTTYTLFALSSARGTSDIDCDATHFCVIWVGIDHNNAFTSGPHAFSTPFEISGPTTTSSPSSPVRAAPTTVPPSSPAAVSPIDGSGASPTPGSVATGTLASTGVSTLLLWLVVLGLLMTVLGTVGRTLACERASRRS